MEDKAISRFFNQDGAHTLAFYLNQNGYEQAKKALKELTPEEILSLVKAANLRGREGPAFRPVSNGDSFPREGTSPSTFVSTRTRANPGPSRIATS